MSFRGNKSIEIEVYGFLDALQEEKRIVFDDRKTAESTISIFSIFLKAIPCL